MTSKRPLRIAPSHYHVGHIVPATVAQEMTFFEEEGLEDYELVSGGLVPALAEKIGLRRAMKEKSIDIVPDAKPLSRFLLRDKGEDIHNNRKLEEPTTELLCGRKGCEKLVGLEGEKDRNSGSRWHQLYLALYEPEEVGGGLRKGCDLGDRQPLPRSGKSH